MKFSFQKPNKNILVLIRKLGYMPKDNDGKEFNCIKYLGGRGKYPRFHLFIKQDKDNNLLFSLHLDQKKPSYRESPAHSGEYEGELVEREKERIIGIMEGIE